MESNKTNGSPLDPAFKRLEDAHRQWHQAQVGYFEPEDFRLAMQSCIQTLRTVTFVLQNNKRALKGFESWYEGRQAQMRADVVLKWLIEARNHIEKQGDLETFSKLTVKVVASYYDNLEVVTVDGKLFDDVDDLLSKVPPCYLVGQVLEHGALRIERRWVANSLPTHELLDAIAHSYTAISQVLKDACIHWSLLPLNTPSIHDEGSLGETDDVRLMCMQQRGEILEGIFSLRSGEFIEVNSREIEIDDNSLEETKKKLEKIKKPTGSVTSFREIILMLFSQAKQVMALDGHHDPIVFLFKENRPAKIIRVGYENRGDKYLIMREVADNVGKLGADSIIHIGEAWTAVSTDIPHMGFAVDSPNRKESLILLASSRTENFELTADVIRQGDNVSLGETNLHENGETVMFAPVFKVWAEQDAKNGK